MRRALFVLLIALFATGCQVRSKVDLHVNANGSGTVAAEVRLDADAAANVPDLAKQLKTADLKSAGWSVAGPEKTADGGAVVRATHTFRDIGEANTVMAQLSNGTGPFSGFHLEQTKSLTRVNTTFTGTIDMSKGVESFGDSQLSKTSGSPLGFDPSEVHDTLGVDWAAAVPVQVVVHLPGSTRTVLPATGQDKLWSGTYGAKTDLLAASSGLNLLPVVLYGFAAVALFLGLIFALLWRAGLYRPKHSRHAGSIRARDLLAGGSTA